MYTSETWSHPFRIKGILRSYGNQSNWDENLRENIDSESKDIFNKSKIMKIRFESRDK